MNTFKKGDRIRTTRGAWMYANTEGVVIRMPRPDRVDVRMDNGAVTFFEVDELIAIPAPVPGVTEERDDDNL